MTEHKDKEKFEIDSKAKWGGKKRRDDTPTFIRNVQVRNGMLNQGRINKENIPVLTMPFSVKIWRQVRWPLFVTIILLLLTSIGFFTHDRLVARSVDLQIKNSKNSEKIAQVDVLIETNHLLEVMSKKYSNRKNVQAAYAWNTVLLCELFGSSKKYLSLAKNAFTAISSATDATSYAARAGENYLKGNFQTALDILSAAHKSNISDHRLKLVKALTLRSLNKEDEALDILKNIRQNSPNYLPALHTLVAISLENKKMGAVKKFSSEFLAVSPGNLFASLALIVAQLPKWNINTIGNDKLAVFIVDMQTLSPKMKKAPTLLQDLGAYVQGRIELFAGNSEKSKQILHSLVQSNRYPDALAWYAKAVRDSDGPLAALEIMKAAGKNPDYQILDLSARCYLDQYQVDKAEEVLKKISDNKNLELDELKWILAVRKGDLSQIKTLLPAKIGSKLMFVGLEAYILLQQAGDIDGIMSLADKMTGDALQCAEGIKAWHGKDVGNAYKKLVRKDVCSSALGSKLLKKHLHPSKIKEMALRVVKSSKGNLFSKIDLALAIWLVDGQKAALKILNDVKKIKPQGIPVLGALANAYIEMGLPSEAILVLDQRQEPLAIALKAHAYTLQKDTEKVKSLISNLSSNLAIDQNHPAIVYWLLLNKLENEDFEGVIKKVDKMWKTAGIWTSEIAELKAKALNAIGSRGDADRWLLWVAKKVKPTVGLAESWQAKIIYIRMNLRRGGAFLFKAITLTQEMYKEGIKGSELSFCYGMEYIRQENEILAIRYWREALSIDPSFLSAYKQLQKINKFSAQNDAVLKLIHPDYSL